MMRPYAVTGATLVSRGGEPKNSQETDQLHPVLEQNDGHFWRFGYTLHQFRAENLVDDIDRQLLGLLRDDARTSVSTLARKLRVARGTVQNRLARLQSDGTIVGYTVRLRPQEEGQRMRALTLVAVEGNRTDEVIRSLRGDPAVAALHTTNGRWDIVAELRADSLEAFDRVLGRIRLIEGISNTETSLLLSTHKL
jgi:DNA-binding Lrp family transcriptional regulator